jgi:transcriptional regulator with XRE-family HTH domain
MASLGHTLLSGRTESGGDVPAPTSHLTVPYLRHWRLHRLMSQSQLVKASGVSAPTIIRGEKGELVSALSATKLARALGVTVRHLQEEEPYQPAQP